MVNKSQINLNEPFWYGLACAALSPGLRSVLVLDGEQFVLRLAAQVMAQLLSEVTGQQVRVVVLGTTETEEDLWGHWTLGQGRGVFEWQPGLLTADELRLILIPDLSQLSLAATRACVTLVGAEVAHLERHEQHQEWQPQLCWLAGCAKSAIGRVSNHLLDRFALRLNGKVSRSVNRTTELLRWLEQPKSEFDVEPLPEAVEVQLGWAVEVKPAVDVEAMDKVLSYFPEGELAHSRRQMALLRLAVACGRLEGLPRVTAAHVDLAAEIIGLADDRPGGTKAQDQQNHNQSAQSGADGKNKAIASEASSQAAGDEPVYEANATKEFQSSALSFEDPTAPYPEDTAPIQRETAALQLPMRRFRAATAARGIVIGVEAATSVQDLALVHTLLEAAKWQKIRQNLRQSGPEGEHGQKQTRLILSPTDFRCYRRAPVAERMLALVLDYTCLHDCRWREALLPYLSWAYMERATVCLIQVGAAPPRTAASNAKVTDIQPEELRAQKIVERSILVPRFSAGLEAGRGRATPLAHGLSLALQTLRHALQHGRSAVQSAVLVMVSDGRGNVPLQLSLHGQVTESVGRQGIEDALQEAAQIRQLDRVRSVVLNPQPRQYPELPIELAQALGAKVVMIPPLETWEVEP